MHLAACLAAALLLSGAAEPPPAAPGATSPEPAPETSGEVPRALAPGKTSWFVLPLAFWLPETRLGFGATGGIHFHLLGARQASSVFAVAAYTLKHQGIVDVSTDLYSSRGSVLATSWRASYFPDVYYGLGPRSRVSNRDPFTRRYVEGIVSPEYAILGGRVRGGPRIEARAEDIRDELPGGVLSAGTIPGGEGFTAVGIGGSVTWDTRDKPLFPSRGAYAQGWALHYPGSIGARHEAFTRGGVEGRLFLPIGSGRVLGSAAFVERASAGTPFTVLPELGSARYLRGWREGRFRDLLAWAAQSEARVPLTDRFLAVAFGALGSVGEDVGALRPATLEVAGGVGLRYRLTPEGANVRLDLAVSDAGPQVYVLVLEAF
jgi:hypothetical protein